MQLELLTPAFITHAMSIQGVNHSDLWSDEMYYVNVIIMQERSVLYFRGERHDSQWFREISRQANH